MLFIVRFASPDEKQSSISFYGNSRRISRVVALFGASEKSIDADLLSTTTYTGYFPHDISSTLLPSALSQLRLPGVTREHGTNTQQGIRATCIAIINFNQEGKGRF